MSESPLLALFVDGDLLAAATLPKKSDNQTLSSAIAPKPDLQAPTKLAQTIENHFFGGKCTTRAKTCFFTAGTDVDADAKAHKQSVINAMKAAGFQCKVQAVDRAFSTDAVMTSKAMKVLYKNHSVTTFVFLSHSPHLEAILEEVSDEGKDSYLVALGNASIAPEVRALLCSATKTGQPSVLPLTPADLFGVPFDESAFTPATAPPKESKASNPPVASVTAAVMPVSTPPPLADQPNPLTQTPAQPAPVTSTPAPTVAPITPAPAQPAAVPATSSSVTETSTEHRAGEGRTVRDQADPTNQLGASVNSAPVTPVATSASSVASATTTAAPTAAASQAHPNITDFRLPSGTTAYWDNRYSRYYYVTVVPGQNNTTSWQHPGGVAEDNRIAQLITAWRQANPAPAAATPAPAAASVVPVTKTDSASFTALPANDKNAIAAAQLQAQPVVINPPVAQPQLSASMSQSINPAPVPTPAPAAASQAPVLPKGWERHIDNATGKPYYYDTVNKRTTWELPPV